MSTPKVTSAHPVVLTIAGSDPSGGAGLQADLRTFAALGAQGTSVVTALTAQNTTTVAQVYPVEPEVVLAQLTTLLDDVHVDAVKVGMLATARTVLAITPILAALPASGVPVVLDPVLTSTTGTRLLDEEAVHALRELARLVDVVTPNLAEAAGLVGAAGSLDTVSHLHVLARQGRELGIPRLLVTGGHLHGPSEAVDVWSDADGELELRSTRFQVRNTHGTGCTLSSALAALRPQHGGWTDTVREAKTWVSEAIRRADEVRLGHGSGPLLHLHEHPRWARQSPAS